MAQGLDDAAAISIHPPRAGRDSIYQSTSSTNPDFNPPSPSGEGHVHLSHLLFVDISIHPPRAGRDDISADNLRLMIISIHPPRAGRDPFLPTISALGCDFNPPSPCGEGQSLSSSFHALQFISIHPPRAGRDLLRRRGEGAPGNFNPPSPCGEGPHALRLKR